MRTAFQGYILIRVAPLALIFVVSAVALASCDNANPGGVRLVIEDQKVSPDEVIKADFAIYSHQGVSVASDGTEYVLGFPEDEIGFTYIYRLSEGNRWERFSGRLGGSYSSESLNVRPGSTELYVRKCGFHKDDGRTVYDWVELARVSPEGRIIDVTGAYLGSLTRKTVVEIGIQDCRNSNWAIEADGSLLVAGGSGLWRVKDGVVHVVTDYSEVSSPVPEGCEPILPTVRVGPHGETLLYPLGRYYSRSGECGPRSEPDEHADIFRLVGDSLRPVYKRNENEAIRFAAVGPDDATYVITWNSRTGGESWYAFVRVKDGEQSSYLKGVEENSPESVDSISFGPNGETFITYNYVTGLPVGGSNESWLLKFLPE